MAKKHLVPQLYKQEDPMAVVLAKIYEGTAHQPSLPFDPNKGVFHRHNQLRRLEDEAKASEFEKTIHLNWAAIRKVKIEEATKLMMLPLNLESEREREKHNRKMMKLERKSKKYDILLKAEEFKRSAAENKQFLKGLGNETSED